MINPGWSSEITSGRISTWCQAYVLAIIVGPWLCSEIKSLFFCERRNIIARVWTYCTRESVFLWSLVLTLFKAVCLQGRLVQSSGMSLWKFSSWCLLAIEQLFVLRVLKWWKYVCFVQCKVGKILAPDISFKIIKLL